MALRYPHERSHGIADRRRIEQALQVLQQRRIDLRERSASTARATNLWRDRIERFQVLQAPIDRAACDPGRTRHGAHATVSSRAGLRCRKQASFAFVKTRTHCLVAASNRSLINHASVINLRRQSGNPFPSCRCQATQPLLDSIISPRRLSLTLADLGGVSEGVLHAVPNTARNFDTIPARPGHERNLMAPYFATNHRDGIAEGQACFWIPCGGPRLELS